MIDKKPVELIALQSANLTQITNKGIKSNWKLKKNITGELLFTLPSKLTDEEVYSNLLFARKYEFIAFNEGIKFQKGKQNVFLLSRIKELELLATNLKDHNDYLALSLDNQTNKEA